MIDSSSQPDFSTILELENESLQTKETEREGKGKGKLFVGIRAISLTRGYPLLSLALPGNGANHRKVHV
jgi:hypothetical protein